VTIELDPSEKRTVVGLLGDAVDAETARDLVKKYRESAYVNEAMQKVISFWDRLLGTVAVKTPDRALDLMLNRWLLYQCVACRVWGRTGFYQSSGAFGFRDQLQDVLALLLAAPRLARTHLLHAASRQFVEGDVQHWWHEPGGQGVRTRFADDRLWLVYAALEYISATGDDGVLDEEVSFLEGRRLEPVEHEAYERPSISLERASLYEHCARAVTISLATGEHGLPLMGTGDWNDGMNLVCGWPGSSCRSFRLSRRWPRRAVIPSARRSSGHTWNVCARASKARGTADGIGAPISTMEPRWDQLRTRNAASTLSRNRGPCCPARRIPLGRGRRWSRWTSS
jgi:cyclic beta-1,2-glucan synthetase